MSKMNVCTFFLCFLHTCVHGSQVEIYFRSSDGSEAKTRQCDTDRMIFKVSEHLQTEVSKHADRNAAENEKDSKPNIVLDCDEETFEIAADFLEGKIPSVQIKARHVAEVLRLASLLGIAEKRMELYKKLAGGTVADGDFAKEICKYKDVQGIKLFMLLVLRDNFKNINVVVRVGDNKATLCLQNEDTGGYCGSLDGTEDVNRIRVCSGAVNMLVSQDKVMLDLLSSFVCVANISELRIDNTYGPISKSVMVYVGAMESIKTLRIDMNAYTRKLRGLKHLRGLVNLSELDVSGCALGRTGKCCISLSRCCRNANARHMGLSEIAGLEGLKKLNISRCQITQGDLCSLGGLETLEELYVSTNSLNKEDVLFIRGMRELTTLDLSHCKLDPGSVSLLQNMQHIRKLKVASNELSEEDVCAIGKMQSLVSLNLMSCGLGPGSLEHLRDLAGLEELVVSDNTLDKSDLAVIGGMESLRALDMCDCKLLGQGMLEPLVNLKSLERLYISRIRLGLDEIQTVGRIVSLRMLEKYYCRLQPGCLEPLRSLKNLQVLGVSGNALSQEDMDVIGGMEELTSLSVRECCLPPGSLVCIENLKKIESLNVSDNRLNKRDMIAISKMNSITRLEMYMNSIYLGSLKHLKDMDNLRYLGISRNELCREDIIAIACMKNLVELNMDSYKVELGSLAHICGSKSLKSLHALDVLITSDDEIILERYFSRDAYVKIWKQLNAHGVIYG